MASKKRNTRLTEVDKETENFDTSDKGEISQSRDIMQGIASIQNTLANFLLRLDGQGKHLDDLTQEIRARDGITERLEKVQDQTVETENLISELQEKNKKMEREMSRLRDYVIRLEYCVNVQRDQIIDLKIKYMENNVIVNGIEEKGTANEPENLAAIIRNILITEMEMKPETADRLQISKMFRMGEFDKRRKYPRPVCIQFAYRNHKDLVMSGVKVLKAKKSPFRFAQQQPEEVREKRKQLFEVQKKYTEKGIETKMNGTKLIFTQSNSVYRDKLGSRPTADEIITEDEVNITVNPGKSVEDNGNRFIGHAVSVESFKQVRKSIVEVMRINTISSASHNIYAYRFTSPDGSTHEGSDDDGEFGAGRALLKTLIDNEVTNALVVVSRWYGSKIGPRRFTHINDAGMSAVKNMQVPVIS